MIDNFSQVIPGDWIGEKVCVETVAGYNYVGILIELNKDSGSAYIELERPLSGLTLINPDNVVAVYKDWLPKEVEKDSQLPQISEVSGARVLRQALDKDLSRGKPERE
jgi:hypothetical protein